jgi:NitT/TauT family transport system substrate-binding protein
VSRIQERLGALTIVVAIVVALGASPAAAKPPTTLRLGVFPNVTHASALVAIESGLLEDALGADVKLEVKYFNSGTTAQTALLSGALDATFIGPNPAINAFAQTGGGIRIVAGATSGGAFLVTKPTITKVADLKGKKVATPSLGNTQDVAAREYFESKGLRTDIAGGGDVSIVPQDNARTLDAFQQGLVDGAWVPEPWASRLVNEAGGRVLLAESTLWPRGRYVTAHLVVTTEYLEGHRSVVRRLIRGHVAATDFLHDNRTVAEKQVNEQIYTATGQRVDPVTVTNAWENLEFTVDPIASSLAKSAKDAQALGFLPPTRLRGIYDLRILNRILEAQGKPRVPSSLETPRV